MPYDSTTGLNPKDALIPFTSCINQKQRINPNISTQVLPAKPERIYALIVNLSLVPLTLRFGEGTAISNEGIPLMGKGASYEITHHNLYRGRIAAIASELVEIAVVECVE